MAIDDGTYLIINAKSKLALDVRAGSDKSGENVRQYTPNGSDAQIWATTTYVNGVQVMCSLTGRALDVANGVMANGTNVRQCTDNNALAQRWLFVADGSTSTYSGKTYDTYVVKSAKNDLFALDISGGSTSAGANAQIYTANGSDAQRWMFVPVMAMTTDGTYEIVSALDTSICIDIAGGSTANGAKAQVYTRNGSNAQIFEAEVDAQTDLVRLLATHSGKALDSDGATKNGQQVHQWAKATTQNQWWLLTRSGKVTLDGNDVPTYVFRAQANNGRALDVAGAKSTPGTTLQVYDRNGSAAQRFALVKTEMLGDSIPAPTRNDVVVQGTGSLTHAFQFACDETAYQVRYRTLTYNAKHTSHTTSAWMSLDDPPESAREGWGDAWSPTFTVESGGIVTVPTEIAATITAGTRDLIEVQVEVRAYRDSHGSTGSKAHGPVTRSTVTFTLAPTLTVTSAKMGATGVDVALSCNYAHAGNRYTVELWQDGMRIARQHSQVDAGTATVTIPLEDLERIPANGSTVQVRATVATADGGTGSATSNATMTWTGGITEATPTIAYETDTLTALVTCASAAGGRCLLEVTDGGRARIVECPEVASGSWRVPYPLGVEWRAVVMARLTNSWLVGTVEGDSSDIDEYVWVWGETWGECCRLRANAGDRPHQGRTHDTNSNLQVTSGRDRPIVFAGRSVKLSLPVEAATYGDSTPNSDREAVERLSWTLGDGWYPVYRSPKGDWHRVAVTNVDTGWESGDWCHAQVEQQAVEP